MKRAIILFTRVPVSGQTKTRLMPFLNGNECANLHKAFIKDIYKTCKKVQCDILIYCTPIEEKQMLQDIIENENSFYKQVGNSLGEKMRNALKKSFELSYESCVLIGTDIPTIKADYLKEAFLNLEKNDIVINPTEDGGYYLIGMKRDYPSIWNIKKYGTNTVIKDTILQIEKYGLSVKVGATCSDIDTKEDLMQLYEDLIKEKEIQCINTWNYLKYIIK
jgi:uncharacterized protein